MSDYQAIEQKLGEFKKKFYLNELLRGGIFFVVIGVLYFLLTAWVEEVFWLSGTMRAVVFWLFVLVELALWFYWIWPALGVMLGSKKPMSHQQAARLIGTQIPEVGDRLINTLDLLDQKQDTDLILASIAQKSKSLSPFYFGSAIDFKDNLKHSRWLFLPISLFLMIWVFGDLPSLFASYKRVAAYNQEFVRPAPYQLVLLNQELKARSNQEIRLEVAAQGSVLPQEVFVVIDGQRRTMVPRTAGQFELLMPPQPSTFKFYFGTEVYRSPEFSFEVLYGPEVNGFEVEVIPPAYAEMSPTLIENTGNIRALAGSEIKWRLTTTHTDQIKWYNAKDTSFLVRAGNQFELTKKVYRNQKYFLSASNTQVGFDPAVAYDIEVYSDKHPKISVETLKDSINNLTHHKILAWDDFLVQRIDVVCYPTEDPKNQRRLPLEINPQANTQGVFSFPGGFQLIKGKTYQYYFEAWDNDAVSGPKSSRSSVFGHQEATRLETQDQLLSQQNKQANQLEEAIRTLAEQNDQVERLEQSGRQKESLNWQDERNLDRILQKQQQQLEQLQEQTKSLKNILERFEENQLGDNQNLEQLKERIDEQQQSLQEQSERWQELQELQQQLQDEDLLEEMAQSQQQQRAQEQNLERLVEMTRRFFVTQKMNQISEQLDDLGKRQEALSQQQSDNQNNGDKEQEQQQEMNEEFESIKQALDNLEQENNKLKTPMALPRDPGGEMDISDQQKKATEALQQGEPAQAQKPQKQAGQKMQEMAQKMGAQMQQMQQQSMKEDTQMLRQVLDNLIVFSLAQEGHMNIAQDRQLSGWSTPDYINRQNDLRDNFGHIDDSLYALSLRQPMISSQVNQSLAQAGYYLDKTLADLAETRFAKAASAQQFVFTQANDLANLLDGVVSKMEQMAMSMPGSGSGQGSGSQGFQLQDIIQQQQSLQGQQGSKGQQQGQNPGGSSQPGQSGQKGAQGDSSGQGQPQGDSGKSGGNGSGDEKGAKTGGQSKSGTYGSTAAERAAQYERYKQQQKLRQELEDRLRSQGLLEENQDLLRKMDQNAQELLRGGVSNKSRALMKEINYQLLKLQEAQYQQEKEEQRESQTNTRSYDPTQRNPWRTERRYFEQLDILIKDALPLQPYYKKQSERYFKIRSTINDQF